MQVDYNSFQKNYKDLTHILENKYDKITEYDFKYDYKSKNLFINFKYIYIIYKFIANSSIICKKQISSECYTILLISFSMKMEFL